MGPHAQDEEIVAIVEADNCAVDAIQYLTGCTFGKGNLIHLDYGKNAFTFVRRSDGKAVRVVVRAGGWGRESGEDATLSGDAPGGEGPSEPGKTSELDRGARAQWILEAPLEDILEIREVDREVPRRARIHESVPCSSCGEHVMETRARLFRGRVLCIPCFERQDGRM
jgi:formylmethanofuran dehydrogenase subunit E